MADHATQPTVFESGSLQLLMVKRHHSCCLSAVVLVSRRVKDNRVTQSPHQSCKFQTPSTPSPPLRHHILLNLISWGGGCHCQNMCTHQEHGPSAEDGLQALAYQHIYHARGELRSTFHCSQNMRSSRKVR